MADEKPAKKKSPLYDAPKGEPKHGAKPEKKPDPEPKAEAKPASDKDATTEKTPTKADGTTKATEPNENAGKKPDDSKAGGEQTKPVDDRAAMHKRHESERRDFHGNMREAMRQMTSRHEKEIKALNEKAAGVSQPAEKVPGNAPEKKEAQAAAAAAPVE